MKRRVLYGAAAVVVLIIAWRLPTAWYYSLPRDPDTPALPFSGVNLLRVTFVIEAILLAVLASARWTWRRIPGDELLAAYRPQPSSDLSRSQALIAVAIITLIAIVLRSYRVGSDLWLDEITPIVDYGHIPAVQLLGSYLRTNSHLLNTLLTMLSIRAFDKNE